ncbi:transcriptional repressor general negative regulator of transcription subunit 4 [Linnemannia exigua]|uniref:Transcriptional repressor general negative regulator of transcription subunit 4 n=1 Tax=Linnemannia exigua TaxID=604196 RepID=A0AAD4HAL7_9FUNG|nr:transcriptional repressor general negative regulator of transcription subunit 4 [Linnemannia exigua]
MMSDEEDYDCPLCMEELDISDRNFRPCPCGYQICRFCWHHIKENLNGRCPACRRVYSEETVEFIPITADELAMIKNEKKAKEREKKEIEAMNRKHLSNMRVVQKSLVYVIGLPTKLANDEHALRQQEYFGQYGKISKVVVNRRNAPMPMPGSAPGLPSVGVYITYIRKEDAAKAIAAIDGSIWDGKILRASYGTTKYCSYYLRGMSCQNPGCMYLHEPGEDADSYSKEDLAGGKHHLQESMVPYDPYIHKPSALGRPALPSQSSSSSLTPRVKPATVAPTHSPAASSLSDWPAPGERPGSEDREDEGSALPATASWAKIGSNPSTPTLINSLPLSRKLTEPPPLRAKGSTTSIITGVVVNNASKDTNDSPALDYAPTPAEALAIEAAAKQQLLQEQRQQQEQQRKILKQQQKQQEETEQQAELLNQKLRKQRQLEKEKEQQELQKQQQQQEMEQKMQAQLEKEKERKRKERLQAEKEAQEKKEKEERERQAAEAKAKQERELVELEEQRRKAQVENLFVTAPTLSLGSFAFNPDASLSTQPLTLGSGLMQLGRETPGSFGLDSFSAFSNLPVTPGHYTGSFNPFSMDDEPLMRRSAVPAGPTRSFLDESEYDAAGRQRPMGPPIPGKPRQTSRFGFAMDNQFGDSYGFDSYSDPIMSPSMQEGFRTLFPNVNVSFGGANGSLNIQQQQQLQQQQQQQQQHLRQLHQQQQQQSFQTSPLLHRQGSALNGMWNTDNKHDPHMLQRNMAQLSMDNNNMQSTPSSRMAEYHQQMQNNHAQRNGPPGITRNTLNPSMIKSPPPGLESLARPSEMANWPGSQQQQQQQQQQQASSRMNGWSNDNGKQLFN